MQEPRARSVGTPAGVGGTSGPVVDPAAPVAGELSPDLLAVAAVSGASLLLGGLTSFAQGTLPE